MKTRSRQKVPLAETDVDMTPWPRDPHLLHHHHQARQQTDVVVASAPPLPSLVPARGVLPPGVFCHGTSPVHLTELTALKGGSHRSPPSDTNHNLPAFTSDLNGYHHAHEPAAGEAGTYGVTALAGGLYDGDHQLQLCQSGASQRSPLEAASHGASPLSTASPGCGGYWRQGPGVQADEDSASSSYSGDDTSLDSGDVRQDILRADLHRHIYRHLSGPAQLPVDPASSLDGEHDEGQDEEQDEGQDGLDGLTERGASGRRSSGGSKKRRRRLQTPVQRKAANLRERKRMCHLNVAFDHLKDRLPNVRNRKKLSRIQTLRAAIFYISLLSECIQSA